MNQFSITVSFIHFFSLAVSFSFAIKCYDGSSGGTIECTNGWCAGTLYEDGRSFHGCDTLGVCPAIGKSGTKCDKMTVGSSCCCDSENCNKFSENLCYAGDHANQRKVQCDRPSCMTINRANGQIVRDCDTENLCPSGENFKDDHCDTHKEDDSIYCCCHGSLCNGHEIPKTDTINCHAGGDKDSTSFECPQGWCTKSVFRNGKVAFRDCDSNYVCPKIGNKCVTVRKGTADESEFCCCDSNNCNSS